MFFRRRPAFYIIALLLLLLIAITVYMGQLLETPKLGEALRKARVNPPDAISAPQTR